MNSFCEDLCNYKTDIDMSIEIQLEAGKQEFNGKAAADISVADDAVLSVNNPDPIQLKIERIMKESAYERKTKTLSKNMKIFKWLLRFFALFFLTLRFCYKSTWSTRKTQLRITLMLI